MKFGQVESVLELGQGQGHGRVHDAEAVDEQRDGRHHVLRFLHVQQRCNNHIQPHKHTTASVGAERHSRAALTAARVKLEHGGGVHVHGAVRVQLQLVVPRAPAHKRQNAALRLAQLLAQRWPAGAHTHVSSLGCMHALVNESTYAVWACTKASTLWRLRASARRPNSSARSLCADIHALLNQRASRCERWSEKSAPMRSPSRSVRLLASATSEISTSPRTCSSCCSCKWGGGGRAQVRALHTKEAHKERERAYRILHQHRGARAHAQADEVLHPARDVSSCKTTHTHARPNTYLK